jgi:hypothetical protein
MTVLQILVFIYINQHGVNLSLLLSRVFEVKTVDLSRLVLLIQTARQAMVRTNLCKKTVCNPAICKHDVKPCGWWRINPNVVAIWPWIFSGILRCDVAVIKHCLSGQGLRPAVIGCSKNWKLLRSSLNVLVLGRAILMETVYKGLEWKCLSELSES